MLFYRILVVFALFVSVRCSKDELSHLDSELIQDSSKNESQLHNNPKIPKAPFDWNLFGDFGDDPCRRQCIAGQSMTCFYRLVVHAYQRLGPECVHCQHNQTACKEEHCLYGDGVATPVMAFNRMIPGPTIEVCFGDRIQAYVLNMLPEPTTVHWHGMYMKKDPSMDGAPHITQSPIPPGEAYFYDFVADRKGSVWYHSHVGWQRGLGVAGPLIIREPLHEQNNTNLYDYDLTEHVLMVQDIIYNNDFSGPKNVLINDHGRRQDTKLPDTNSTIRYKRLNVLPGKRYRIRVINNGIFNCPLEFAIEDHEMLLISTDGNDIEPKLVDSFFMGSAERYDFVITASKKLGNYWIGIFGNNACDKFYQGAVLHYIGASNGNPSQPIEDSNYGRPNAFVRANYCNFQSFSKLSNFTKMAKKLPEGMNASSFRSVNPSPWTPDTEFHTIYTTFSFKQRPNGGFALQIDGISSHFEKLPYSMWQARDIIDQDKEFCNRTALLAAGKNCTVDYCECPNVVRLPAYKPIEMVVVNFMTTPHPFHTHGITYRVVGYSNLTVEELHNIEEADRSGKLRRLPVDIPAVEKDTMLIPPLGYMIVRFNSDNPGFWFYHCHIEPHALAGMIAVLKIGENDDMQPWYPKVEC